MLVLFKFPPTTFPNFPQERISFFCALLDTTSALTIFNSRKFLTTKSRFPFFPPSFGFFLLKPGKGDSDCPRCELGMGGLAHKLRARWGWRFFLRFFFVRAAPRGPASCSESTTVFVVCFNGCSLCAVGGALPLSRGSLGPTALEGGILPPGVPPKKARPCESAGNRKKTGTNHGEPKPTSNGGKENRLPDAPSRWGAGSTFCPDSGPMFFSTVRPPAGG